LIFTHEHSPKEWKIVQDASLLAATSSRNNASWHTDRNEEQELRLEKLLEERRQEDVSLEAFPHNGVHLDERKLVETKCVL